MPSDQAFDPTRRHIVGGLASGVAAAAMAGPALGQQSLPSTSRAEGQGAAAGGGSLLQKQDPTEQYPSPPFPEQPQEWPGLASEMEPRPDHGEESYRGSGRLTGRKALITGGDSGIGRAAAIAYAREGADVAINYLEAEESDAREVIELVEAEGRTAVAIPGDIREESFCRELVESAVEQLGGLDILVNNAARQQWKPSISDITTEDFDATLKTNLYAMLWITQAAMPHLEAGASIINTASVVAYDPPEILLDYSMTKAAIVNFTQCLAKQVAGQGIRVNAVAPGPFWTPLQPSGGQPQENVTSFGKETPMGRPGQPVELSGVYVLLASQESSYATGQVYGATGGSGGP
ncbi:SDR family oxidoreductase [Billgrantia diversa]|uniref:SDR family oxidoreductase n=1 Tax=Halomonas sp. MCCC 1A13316 TaxID=2733487 RepID=UPI0022B2A6CA|nr:SDR family oxidoreductase [Halomonas sp. MCCC 1A13316]